MTDNPTPGESMDTPLQSPAGGKQRLGGASSLTELQTDEQRQLLDTVAKLRKCGISGDVALPQLVACGAQSAGKSSVFKALTGASFPTGEGTCTRITTEVHLRRAEVESVAVRIIADKDRPVGERAEIGTFQKTMANLDELPTVIEAAMAVMGVVAGTKEDSFGLFDESKRSSSTFAKDVLSIEIEGPTHPQLTIVDIPGLIETATKDLKDEDIPLVASITDKYISEPRTICLAIVPGSGDIASHKILEKAKQVDPKGNRTLGIITKPDRIEGKGTKQAYLELAKNDNIPLKLGWHVLKNQGPDEEHLTLAQRKSSETGWLANSVFNALSPDCLGIDALKSRLSILLCNHVKRELPKLRGELDKTLEESEKALNSLGDRRSSADECKQFLTDLSMRYFQTCKAAIDGYYEGKFFHGSEGASITSIPIRARARIQELNFDFNDVMIKYGHKYQFKDKPANPEKAVPVEVSAPDEDPHSEDDAFLPTLHVPSEKTQSESLDWVRQKLRGSRGKELAGNYNPLLIGELFWEQSERWADFAEEHVDLGLSTCKQFLRYLLEQECPKDIHDRIWALIDDELKRRKKLAYEELTKIMADLDDYPINYNHYYTDNVAKMKGRLDQAELARCIEEASTEKTTKDEWRTNFMNITTTVDVHGAAAKFLQRADANMETAACRDALISMRAIYKVKQKVFIDNVTVQVVERHIVRGLEKIFSPMTVASLTNENAMTIAGEPLESQKERKRLEEKIQRLREGRDIFKSMMGVRLR